MKRLSAAALLGASTILGQTAQAQSIGEQIFFGDSLSDTGNAYTVIGQPPVFNSPASSDGGRYSDGPMWVDYRSSTYALYAQYLLTGHFAPGTSDVNFAVGGSQSCGLASCVGVSGAQALAQSIAPGTLVQINDYLTAVKTGQLPAINAKTFVSIFTGGNDYSPFAASAGAAATPATEQALVTSVLNNISTGISELTSAGVRQLIVFNQFDIGLVPQFKDPALAAGLASNADQVATALTNLSNSEIEARLAAAQARTGASIIQIDVNALYRDEFNNPAVWGLTNVTGTCVTGNFVTPTGLCNTKQEAASLMFWQPTHPSGTTHANIAALVAGTLQTVYTAPSVIAVQSQLALRAAQAEPGGISDRLGEFFDRPYDLFADIAYADGDRDAVTDRAAYNYTTQQQSVGFSYRLDPALVVGLAASNDHSRASVALASGSLDLDGYGAKAFAAYRLDGWTALLTIGGIAEDYSKVNRNSGFTPFPTATAAPTGATYGASALVSYALPLNGFTLTPSAGLNFNRVEIDSYQETGTRLLNLTVNQQFVSSALASVGVEASGEYQIAGLTALPRLGLNYQKDFADNDAAVNAGLSDGQPVVGVPGADKAGAVKLDVGLGVPLFAGAVAGLRWHQSLTHSDGGDQSVSLSLSIPL